MAAQNFALLGRHLVCPRTHFERLSKGPETHIAAIFYVAIRLFQLFAVLCCWSLLGPCPAARRLFMTQKGPSKGVHVAYLVLS